MSADFTKYSVVNVASTTSPIAITTNVVAAGPARLFGIYINTTLSAHVLYIKDYDATVSPIRNVTVATIKASATAGEMFNFPGLEFRGSLRVVTSNSVATGNVTVAFKPGTASSLGVSAP